MNTHNRIRYFLTISFVTGYVQVSTYDFNCKMYTNNTFLHCLCRALTEKHGFYFCHSLKLYMILYSTSTVFFHCSIVFCGLG